MFSAVAKIVFTIITMVVVPWFTVFVVSILALDLGKIVRAATIFSQNWEGGFTLDYEVEA